MKLRHKLVITTLGVIIVVLAIMLGIALFRGDDTHTDKDNSDVDSNTAGVVGWPPAPGDQPSSRSSAVAS